MKMFFENRNAPAEEPPEPEEAKGMGKMTQPSLASMCTSASPSPAGEVEIVTDLKSLMEYRAVRVFSSASAVSSPPSFIGMAARSVPSETRLPAKESLFIRALSPAPQREGKRHREQQSRRPDSLAAAVGAFIRNSIRENRGLPHGAG